MLIKHEKSMTAAERIAVENTNNLYLESLASAEVGTIFPYAGRTAPRGFMLCDGAELDVNAYPELFTVIGYTYGGEEDVFNLPDLRGKTLVGQDLEDADFYALGKTGGNKAESIIDGEEEAHSYAVCNFIIKVLHNKAGVEALFAAGTTVVFVGGDAESSFDVQLSVDGELSPDSTNPVENRVVSQEILKQEAQHLTEMERLVATTVKKAKLEAHPIGSLLLTANDTNPAATLGGTWIIERCLYGGELLAAGQIYNGTVLNRAYDANTLVSAVAIFETADNKTVYIQNNLKDTLSLESGVFKVKTSGVVGVVDVDYYVGGHLGANIGALWFSTHPGSPLPDTVGIVQNGGLMGTLNSNAGFGGTSAKYQYYVSDNDAGSEFLINPQFMPYGGSFEPCGGGVACGMYVRVYAKGSTRYVWKRTK